MELQCGQNDLIYRIADHNVRIRSLYPRVHTLCAAYRTDGEAEVVLEINREDIVHERERAAQEKRAEGVSLLNFSDAYLETLIVYRRLAEYLLKDDLLLFHGSAIALDGEGYLFIARSGTGKSTHTRLWREMFGDRAVMVNDDKPLLRITDTGSVVYGTPWAGKHGLNNNIRVPLKAVCLLERGKKNQIAPIAPEQAWPALVQHCYRPQQAEMLKKTLALTQSLAGAVRMYCLRCNTSPEAARVAWEGMNGGEYP